MRIQFRSIICATDFSDYSNRTIAYGAAIAREYGAKLYACHVIDLSGVAIYGEFQLDPVGQQLRVRQEANSQLEEILEPYRIDCEPLITVGQPAAEIARIVEEKDIDLVITATRGHAGLKRLLLGSVTQRLMRTLPCPLLAIHSPEQAGSGPETADVRFKKVLIGCDFSEDSLLALDYGLSLAQEFESELHLVHVIEPAAYYDLMKSPENGTNSVPPVPVDVFAERLKGLVSKEAKNWCSLQAAVLRGRPYEELVTYATARKIDMIVLGVRGYGLVRSILMGSTTDRVVRRAPCPVLSVSSQIQDAGTLPTSRQPGA
jgi:nucleotide-binding universal stress UspA family protein